MGAKSTPTKFGTIAIANHWISAILILAMIVLGFSFAASSAEATKVAIMRWHAPLGVLILVLTVLRIVWWIFIDKKPEPVAGTSRPMHILASATHGVLYLIILVMGASGIGMMVLSGAGEILFGGANRPLPDFDNFAPHIAHGLGAFALIALLVLHVVAAIYHQVILRDGLMSRMGVGS